MNFIPNTLTIHQLLNNPTEQFLVPSYQRRYAWKDPQTYALFKDIDMLQPNEGHLFGMLILHTALHHGGVNTIDIVDGQQRLTSISILLMVLREHFQAKENKHVVGQIDLLLYCGKSEPRSQKLLLGELDNPDYLRLLEGRTDGYSNDNIREAYITFSAEITYRIEEKGDGWIDGFYDKLVHTARIIRLDVQQAPDAYKLFETINNRGLRLSATDILKNYILGHAAKMGEQKLKAVKTLWAELIMSLDGIPTDDFFRQYISSVYTRKITRSKLIMEFKEHYLKNILQAELIGEYSYNSEYYDSVDPMDDEYETDDDLEEEEEESPKKREADTDDTAINRVDIESFLKNIVDAAICYAKIWSGSFNDPAIDRRLNALHAIKSFPSYIYLMHYLRSDRAAKEKLEILDMIASLMLRRHICTRRTSENDDIFAHLMRIEYDDRYLEKVKDSLSVHYPNDEEFVERFPTHELKGKLRNRAKYILAQIEYYQTGNTNEFTLNLGKDVHLEHIIPQKIDTQRSKSEFGDWETYLGEKARTLHRKNVNYIGNMTLLSGELNISASNNPFHRKKECYQKSNIKLTEKLGNEMNDFRFQDMTERGKDLALDAVEIWKIA